DERAVRWEGTYKQLSLGDHALFLSYRTLFIGTLTEIRRGNFLLFTNIKLFDISNSDFLALDAVTPENISTTMYQFNPFITQDPIDIKALTDEITRKKFISFYIYDEAITNLENVHLDEK